MTIKNAACISDTCQCHWTHHELGGSCWKNLTCLTREQCRRYELTDCYNLMAEGELLGFLDGYRHCLLITWFQVLAIAATWMIRVRISKSGPTLIRKSRCWNTLRTILLNAWKICAGAPTRQSLAVMSA